MTLCTNDFIEDFIRRMWVHRHDPGVPGVMARSAIRYHLMMLRERREDGTH